MRGIPRVRPPALPIAGIPAGNDPGCMSATGVQTRASAVALEGVTKVHGRGKGSVRALDDVSLAFESGTFTAIMGPSGSGKTTLIQIAAGLARPDRGMVRIGATELGG